MMTESQALQTRQVGLSDRLHVDRLPFAYLELDADFHVREWNVAAEGLFGYARQEALGRSCIDLIVPLPLSHPLQQTIDRIRAGDMQAHSVNENRAKDGRVFTCQWHNTPLVANDGGFAGVISLAEDVTERKRAEQAHDIDAVRLQALSRRLVQVQEEERRHLARELHDEIGQMLTGLAFLLKSDGDLDKSAVASRIEQASGLVDDLIHKIRRLSSDLRPAALDHLGLVPALVTLFERYTAQTRVAVEFRHQGADRRFASEVETTAYRIVQEGLTNVARHSGTSQATVRVWTAEARLNLQIEDRGRGFETDVALSLPLTGGIAGMQERVKLLDGELTIESQPGAGTQVTATLPCFGQSQGPPHDDDHDPARG